MRTDPDFRLHADSSGPLHVVLHGLPGDEGPRLHRIPRFELRILVVLFARSPQVFGELALGNPEAFSVATRHELEFEFRLWDGEHAHFYFTGLIDGA